MALATGPVCTVMTVLAIFPSIVPVTTVVPPANACDLRIGQRPEDGAVVQWATRRVGNRCNKLEGLPANEHAVRSRDRDGRDWRRLRATRARDEQIEQRCSNGGEGQPSP